MQGYFGLSYLAGLVRLKRIPILEQDDPKALGLCTDADLKLALMILAIVLPCVAVTVSGTELIRVPALRVRLTVGTLVLGLVSLVLVFATPWIGWCMD